MDVVGGLIIGTKRLLDFVDNNPTIMTMPIAIAHPDFREELARQVYEAKLMIPACNPENI